MRNDLFASAGRCVIFRFRTSCQYRYDRVQTGDRRFSKKRVRFRAAVPTDEITDGDRAQLWLRVARESKKFLVGAFDNLQDRPAREPRVNQMISKDKIELQQSDEDRLIVRGDDRRKNRSDPLPTRQRLPRQGSRFSLDQRSAVQPLKCFGKFLVRCLRLPTDEYN